MENHKQLFQYHVLLVTFPAQGHINPALQFASKLIKSGIEVTFATSLFAHLRMTKHSPPPQGLNFAVFSDGYDVDGFKPKDMDGQHYMSQLQTRGSDALRDVINRRQVTCLVYTLLLPWAAEVAREFDVPSALLWIQSATVLDIYYHYFFSGYGNEIKKNGSDPNWKIQLPGLPLLETRDLPSFIVPNDSSSEIYSFVLPTFKSQLVTLNDQEVKKGKPTILVNTFDALESEALRAVDKYNMISIGPLVSILSSHATDAFSNSFGNLFEQTKDYKKWLDSKAASSVIYVSFGSFLNLERQQMVEIAEALFDSGRPFLWVIRAKENEKQDTEEHGVMDEEELLSSLLKNYNNNNNNNGVIVPWCSQVEVLSHPAVGCFLTHCGWNSTLESLVCGVPVIAFPKWTDQGTNAKLLESVCQTGVRVLRVKDMKKRQEEEEEEDGGSDIVERDEIKRCIEVVMEAGGGISKGMEFRKNAEKWKELAREAMREGGSSDNNLKSFLQDLVENFSRKDHCGNNFTT